MPIPAKSNLQEWGMSKDKKFRHGHFLESGRIALDQDKKTTAQEPESPTEETVAQEALEPENKNTGATTVDSQESAAQQPTAEPEPALEELLERDGSQEAPAEASEEKAAPAEPPTEEEPAPAEPPAEEPAPKQAPEPSPAPKAAEKPASGDPSMQTQKMSLAPELDYKRTAGHEYSLFGDRKTGAAAPQASASRSTKEAPSRQARPSDDTLRLRREEIERARRARAANAAVTSPARPRSNRRVDQLPKREYSSRNRWGVFSFFFGFIGLIVKVIFVTVLVMALSAWLGFEGIRWFVKTQETVVPNLRGMRVENAIKMASDKKLAIFQERTEANGLVAPGEIIDQKPLPGLRTKEGTAVRVTVSSGRPSLVVPDVVGETRENAINKIKGARLEIGNVTLYNDPKVPQGVVISQDPPANKGLEKAEKVDILVSKGPEGKGLTMPDLTGKPLSEAKAALEAIGVSDVQTDPPGVGKGKVVSQEPLNGKIVHQTEHVVLKIQD